MKQKMINIPVDFKVKASSDSSDIITIEGFANTTTVDRMGDIILEEAWTKGGMDNYLKNPIILAYHKHDKPIGKMVDYSVNNKGLKITVDISSEVGEIYSLIKSEVLRTFSVGFRTKDADYDSDTDIFVIKDLELLEVSVVSIPANADSTFSVRKSFETDQEAYASFKSEFEKDANSINDDHASDLDSDDIEEQKMSDIDKEKALEAMRKQVEQEIKEKAEAEAKLAETISKEVEKATKSTVEVVGESVEKLQAEINTRLQDETKSVTEVIESLRAEIKENAEKLEKANKSKMRFKDKEVDDFGLTTKETDEAILISKILARPIEDTKFGQVLMTKSAQEHISGMTAQDWETGFTTRLWEDIREKLIVEPMFTTMNMPNVTLNMPLNPEAGYGTWVTNAQLNAATSSGTTRIHAPLDTSITAHKLATKELLGYEEEDDSLIALLPIIRDAAIRRMAKSSDKALLLGDSGVSAGSGEGNYPFNGLATIGIDDSRTTTIAGTLASPTAVTVANLQTMRRTLGVHGHSPSDVVYVVNHNVYFDLLEDDDFRTMEKVGVNATILRGQIGMIAGSPVIVSGEFPTAAAGNAAAICVNMSNYIKGDYKGLRVERERSVENQTNLLVVTRRFGMLELFPANTTVATLINPAS